MKKSMKLIMFLLCITIAIIIIILLSLKIFRPNQSKNNNDTLSSGNIINIGYELYGNEVCEGGHFDEEMLSYFVPVDKVCKICGETYKVSGSPEKIICENCGKITNRCRYCGKLLNEENEDE